MLVLTRRRGEVLLIGEKIRVSVRDLSRHRVKLCVDAPVEIRILRGELSSAMVTRRPR